MPLTPAPARPSRALAGLFVAALPTALLAAAPTASAAEPVADQTLTWKVSQQFVDHFAPASYNQNTLIASGGATLTADKETVFVDGTGWYNATTGDAQLQYSGTITGSFVIGSPFYSIAITDPAITIKDGVGQVTADVDWTVPGDEDPAGGADDVLLTTFDADASSWSDGTLQATPAWAGVLPAGSDEATALGLAADRPVDGQAFAPEFLTALNPGVRAHFYASGSGSDPKKAPASLSATAAAPSATATVVESGADGASIRVTGTGYQAGGVGIYVGLTEAGPVQTTNSSAYRGTIWINGREIGADGSFDRTIELTPEEVATLDPAGSYEVHTQKAHGQSSTDPSQSVRLPVTLDLPARLTATTTTASPVTTSYSAKGAKLTASVPGATGRVRLTVGGTTKTTWLKDGTAAFLVPSDLTARIHTARVDYLGNSTFAPSSDSTRVTVRSTPTTTAASVTTTPTTRTSGKLAIKVTNTATNGSPAPRGKVRVTLSRADRSVTLTRTLQWGKTTPTVQRLSQGTWTARVSYAGESGKFIRSSSTTTFTVR